MRTAISSNCLFFLQHVHVRQARREALQASSAREEEKANLGDWLHFAVTSGVAGEEVVRYLVEQGADVNTIKVPHLGF